MIPILLIGGLGLLAAVAITFWDQIKKFLGLALEKVKKVVRAAIVGVAAYVQTRDWREGLKAAYKFYSKNENVKWQESVVTKEISVDEWPAHIRAKVERSSNHIDISEELELELP